LGDVAGEEAVDDVAGGVEGRVRRGDDTVLAVGDVAALDTMGFVVDGIDGVAVSSIGGSDYCCTARRSMGRCAG
jgi:hypothetical protein